MSDRFIIYLENGSCYFIVCLFSLPAAIARFSEAILDFLADKQAAAEAHLREEDFDGEVYAAYEQLFNVWLLSKESKVRACGEKCWQWEGLG